MTEVQNNGGMALSDIDRNDPLYKNARKQVMLAHLEPVIKVLRQKPQKMTEDRQPYRLLTSQLRTLVAALVLISCATSGLLNSRGHLSFAFWSALIGVGLAITLGVCLLWEVLIGAGWDVEKEYSGPNGPFRVYVFIPSLRGPVELFAYLALVVAGVIAAFAEIFMSVSRMQYESFGRALDGVSAFYLSVVTFATVGYGDIVPKDSEGKLLVCAEILLGVFVIAVILATSISWALVQRQQVAEERSAQRDREVQHRESLMKEHGLGAYAEPGSLDNAILAKMNELRNSQEK